MVQINARTAMYISKKQQYIVGFTALLFTTILLLAIPGMFESLDQEVLKLEYNIRGESPIDSNIVVLYFDADDIRALGGVPLKRSYYALVINALHEAGARAIGVDIAFAETNEDHREQDNLLSTVVREVGTVVLSGYFHSSDDATPSPSELSFLAGISYKIPPDVTWISGSRIELPYSDLAQSARSVGHTHLTDDSRLPVFVKFGNSIIPAFAFEVFRISVGATQQDIMLSSRSARLDIDSAEYQIPFDNDGNTTVNFVGGIQSLQMVPAIKFLKAYDTMNAGSAAHPVAGIISNKVVLLGIIAEGRGKFIETPFTKEFPSIGIHAMFIHNALHDNFIRRIPRVYDHVLVLGIGILSIVFFSRKKEIVGLLGVASVLTLYISAVIILFSTVSHILPVTAPTLSAILVSLTMLTHRHRAVQSQVNNLITERENVNTLLREKEIKLQSLEAEHIKNLNEGAKIHRENIKKEIQQYEEEIVRLKSLATDLLPALAPNRTSDRTQKEICGIIYSGNSPMEEIVSSVKKVARSNATVLLMGESGTGKELVAKAIHAQSDRKEKPFIAVNCGALTETLLESELFGHERGAFTGATKEKEGRFEVADGGTIFLDEIGDISEAFQVKLLRILQDGTFERVGSTQMKKVDIRIIAATNKNLEQEVTKRTFREDLYYRLNVFPIHLPPLRERVEDIPFLIDHFLSKEKQEIKCSIGVMNALKQYGWRGNIRELQSIVKRAVLLATADGRNLLRIKDIPEEIMKAKSTSLNLEEHIVMIMREKKFSRSAISETAEEIGGLNRGTVAEYFRGYCFKSFCESKWSFAVAIDSIAQSDDGETKMRVEKKLKEYLVNAVECAGGQDSIENVQLRSIPKHKNLPQKYHQYLQEIITSYHRKEWSV